MSNVKEFGAIGDGRTRDTAAIQKADDKVTVNLFEALESSHIKITGNYPYAPQAVIRFHDPATKVLRIRTPEFLTKVTVNGPPVTFQPGIYLELQHNAMAKDEIVLDFDFSLKEIISPCGKYVAIKRGPLLLAEDSRGIVPEAKVSEQRNGRMLCEYAVAGNLMDEANTLTVWFPR